ncbi:MAG TPA: Rieske 2Fe-2S domain-containing protein, partial [Ktedonobacteraceae bacterium]|nr:Rieske 2Fe-2S domain-containing protein [Ktedonobacteraceae bacterium]
GADIVFVFAWITLLLAGPLRSGMFTLDGLLVSRLLERFSPGAQVWMGRLTSFFLGVGNARPAPYYAPEVEQVNPAYQQRQPQQVSYKARIAAQRRSLENRRNFLWGIVAGGLGVLGITLVGRVVHFGDDASTPTITNPGSTTSGSGTATGGSSNVIAQTSAVAANSAVTFTIPSNGDPGVLIHLNNGRFVCYDATCTHAGCPVSFDSGSSLLICPCHGAEFDPANNANVVQGPAQTPLTSVPINVNSSTGAITLQ